MLPLENNKQKVKPKHTKKNILNKKLTFKKRKKQVTLGKY